MCKELNKVFESTFFHQKNNYQFGNDFINTFAL